ncbi:MAG: N-acetylglucosamine kinase [Rhizobiaceae bacterium]|nr:N-acetylglucosamine kinase [Rhizobiaceae bacterium]
MSDFLIGIDGGGTSCRAAVATADGIVVGMAKSGPANILTDIDGALGNIAAASRGAFINAGLDPSGITRARALLGLAGSNVGDVSERLTARLPFSRSEIVSDGLIALQGAFGDEDGAIAVIGTGTMYLSRRGDGLRSFGGWGFIVADQGSGARLGHALLQECLLASDGIRPGSPLTADVLAEFGDDPSRLVAFARYAAPSDFGRYSPRIFAAANSSDPVGLKVLRAGAAAIDETLDAMVRAGGERICLLGGLSAHYPVWLSEANRSRLVAARADALSGAVALAVSRFGGRMAS